MFFNEFNYYRIEKLSGKMKNFLETIKYITQRDVIT